MSTISTSRSLPTTDELDGRPSELSKLSELYPGLLDQTSLMEG